MCDNLYVALGGSCCISLSVENLLLVDILPTLVLTHYSPLPVALLFSIVRDMLVGVISSQGFTLSIQLTVITIFCKDNEKYVI